MANFEFDPRGLPQNFDKTKYYNVVKEELVSNYDIDPADETTIAAVVGILLLGEYYDNHSTAFDGAIRQARDEMLQKVPRVSLAQTLSGASSAELVRELKPFSNNEVREGLKKVRRENINEAWRNTPRERIAEILKKLSRAQADTLFDKLPDAKRATELKKTALADLDKEFVKVPRTEVDEMLRKVSDGEIGELLNKASRSELDEVMSEIDSPALLEVVISVSSLDENQASSKEVYRKIFEIITNFATKSDIFYQEFASVGRYVISRATEIPFGHPRFERQVQIGLDQYISGAPVFDSLELPPLQGDNGADTEIIPDNIKAVSMVYAAYQLDVGMRMIDVVDRINEIFHNGQLPIGFDAGGRAIDDYNWSAEDRLNAVQRRSQYSRVLGMSGGDISKEVQANTQFDSLFMRFLSSLAEYDRQQRVSDIVERVRPRNLTSEYVRKAGRDLAANLSLYGWAATHFAARRLRQHIEEALNILKQPSVQKSYGATNLYQVIERVASLEFNSTPNIVKHRTMAEAGKQILDLVAKYAHVWSRSDGRPLFTENTGSVYTDTTGYRTNQGEIDDADRDTFLSLTQQWLAVNGIKDAQVDKYSEPEISQYAPSIPGFGGFGGNGMSKTNGGSTSPDQMDRIKQMVTQGQMPSLDQLQGMFKM